MSRIKILKNKIFPPLFLSGVLWPISLIRGLFLSQFHFMSLFEYSESIFFFQRSVLRTICNI